MNKEIKKDREMYGSLCIKRRDGSSDTLTAIDRIRELKREADDVLELDVHVWQPKEENAKESEVVIVAETLLAGDSAFFTNANGKTIKDYHGKERK